MHERRNRSLSLLGLFFVLTGCAAATGTPSPTEGAEPARVTGSVTYRERVALPPTALIKVRLADVSRADAAAVILAEQSIVTAGRQVPFEFELQYDPAMINPAHAYAVQVRIEDDGRLLFISDTQHPVITRDQPRHADIVVRRVAGPAQP